MSKAMNTAAKATLEQMSMLKKVAIQKAKDNPQKINDIFDEIFSKITETKRKYSDIILDANYYHGGPKPIVEIHRLEGIEEIEKALLKIIRR